MNKTNRLVDYTINPVKGLCPMACSWCYARRMYKRFKWDEEIRFALGAWLQMKHDIAINLTPSRYFVGSTIELFGDWIDDLWLRTILETISLYKKHTFLFLTKKPEKLIKWSPFPDNCWIGASVTANGDMTKAYYGLSQIEASVKFISFEPLLGSIGMSDHINIKKYVDWVIIGSRTQPVKHPPIEWVNEIVRAADKARIPVFVKETMASHYEIQRQEFPDKESRYERNNR